MNPSSSAASVLEAPLLTSGSASLVLEAPSFASGSVSLELRAATASVSIVSCCSTGLVAVLGSSGASSGRILVGGVSVSLSDSS